MEQAASLIQHTALIKSSSTKRGSISYFNVLVGFIPPNKILQTTLVALRAITNTWNVSVYIHVIDKKKIPHP